MLSLLRPHWVSMTVSMSLLSAATVLILWQPLLVGRLVDRATTGALNLGAALAVLAVLMCQLALEGVGHFQLDRTGERIVLRLRTEFTEHVVRLPIGLLDRARTGDLLARGTSDAGQLRDMPRAVGDIAFGMLTLLGAGAFMLSIDALTLCVVVAVMTVAFGAGSPFLSRIQRDSLNRQVALVTTRPAWTGRWARHARSSCSGPKAAKWDSSVSARQPPTGPGCGWRRPRPSTSWQSGWASRSRS